MIPVHDAFKVGARIFSNGAEIDMNHHENGDDETGDNMEQIGQVKTAGSKNDCRDGIR
ncbi:MAG: hypothetical protein H8D67_24435, partial [Deltaproteobacteria bacterium]|nr:hypothetical protein [Deltaproteobacteria bacterium]